MKEKKIKQTIEKMKPMIPLKPEERAEYREQYFLSHLELFMW